MSAHQPAVLLVDGYNIIGCVAHLKHLRDRLRVEPLPRLPFAKARILVADGFGHGGNSLGRFAKAFRRGD